MQKPAWYDLCLPQKEEDGSFEHKITYGSTSSYSSYKLTVNGHDGIVVINESYKSRVFSQEVRQHLEILKKAARHMKLDLKFNSDSKAVLRATVTAKDRTYTTRTERTYTFWTSYEYCGEDDFKMITEAAKIYLDWCVKEQRLPIDRMIRWLFAGSLDYYMLDYDCELVRKIKKEQEEETMRAEQIWAESKVSRRYYCVIHINLNKLKYSNREAFNDLTVSNFQHINQIARKSRTKIFVGKKGTIIIQADKEEYVNQGVKEVAKFLKCEFKNSVIKDWLEERSRGMTERQRKLAGLDSI